MSCILGVVLTRIIIDVSLAFVALFVGFFVALLYFRNSQAAQPSLVSAPQPTEASPASDTAAEKAANDAARAAMAAQHLRDLAAKIASDVGAHNTFVEGITDQLESLRQGDAGNGDAVMGVVAKMLEANKKLADRLDDAEQKIQAQAEEIRTQQSEARTDALTRLANRRAFDAFLAECVEKRAAAGTPVSLVIFDVDHFKKFNDQHGHPAGDEVLRTVGRTLTRVVKSGDLACRYGGEEFAVILANTKAAEAQIAAERVRKAIESMPVEFGGQTLHVTASIGMAECQPGEEAAPLIRRADESVYASKKSGRNCSHWSDGEQPVRIASASAGEIASPAKKQPAAPIVLAPIAAKLPDRAAFADELKRRIAESHRFGFPVTLLYFRVKDFKSLEHIYGNATGELLLDSLAAFVQSTLRDMDLLGRLENGELIVMLPGSTASAAKIVGQRVKASISLCPIPLGAQQVRLELDMGVATVRADQDAPQAMASARADLEAAALAEAVAQQEAASAEPATAGA